MGYKTLRQYYGIGHIVHVIKDTIWIGSPYCPETIGISIKTGKITTLPQFSINNVDIQRYIKELTADQETGLLKKLIDAPDCFPVAYKKIWTHRKGNILLKRCEDYGFPNCTTDGDLMYENRFFLTRKEAVKDARYSALCCMRSCYRQFFRMLRDAFHYGYRTLICPIGEYIRTFYFWEGK